VQRRAGGPARDGPGGGGRVKRHRGPGPAGAGGLGDAAEESVLQAAAATDLVLVVLQPARARVSLRTLDLCAALHAQLGGPAAAGRLRFYCALGEAQQRTRRVGDLVRDLGEALAARCADPRLARLAACYPARAPPLHLDGVAENHAPALAAAVSAAVDRAGLASHLAAVHDALAAAAAAAEAAAARGGADAGARERLARLARGYARAVAEGGRDPARARLEAALLRLAHACASSAGPRDSYGPQLPSAGAGLAHGAPPRVPAAHVRVVAAGDGGGGGAASRAAAEAMPGRPARPATDGAGGAAGAGREGMVAAQRHGPALFALLERKVPLPGHFSSASFLRVGYVEKA
jgi:hypothetical protein